MSAISPSVHFSREGAGSKSNVRRDLSSSSLACSFWFSLSSTSGIARSWSREGAPGTGRAGKVETVPTAGTAGFVTDLEVEFLKPLYLGDKVTQVSQTLLDVNPRKTRVGDGAFSTYESFYQNQRGERVSRQKMTLYSYVPNPQPAGGGRPGGGNESAEKPAQPMIVEEASPPRQWPNQAYAAS